MRQASLEVDRTDLGLHFLAGQSWSLNAPSKVGIDPRSVDAPGVIDFESVPGFIAAICAGVRAATSAVVNMAIFAVVRAASCAVVNHAT